MEADHRKDRYSQQKSSEHMLDASCRTAQLRSSSNPQSPVPSPRFRSISAMGQHFPATEQDLALLALCGDVESCRCAQCSRSVSPFASEGTFQSGAEPCMSLVLTIKIHSGGLLSSREHDAASRKGAERDPAGPEGHRTRLCFYSLRAAARDVLANAVGAAE